MLDFTSALYLGFRHASPMLRPWSQLTTGVPAALREPAGAGQVAAQVARLQGCEQAVLARSTLHLCWDLFALLAQEGVAIFLDERAYPIAAWGVERAAGRGIPVQTFAHNDVAALQRHLRRGVSGLRPVVVSDGLCHCCGCTAPLAAYVECVRRAGGLLIIDDTQALGLLGHSPTAAVPYGHGGGGSLRWRDVTSPQVLVISSLAKSFGAPLAALAGSAAWIERFAARSATRVHCSPPSAADLYAAANALYQNHLHGDRLRRALAQRVHYFRNRLAALGLATTGGLFPVQTLPPLDELDAKEVYQELLRLGVRAVLRKNRHSHGPDAQISFVITARHTRAEVDQAIKALQQIVQGLPQPAREAG